MGSKQRQKIFHSTVGYLTRNCIVFILILTVYLSYCDFLVSFIIHIIFVSSLTFILSSGVTVGWIWHLCDDSYLAPFLLPLATCTGVTPAAQHRRLNALGWTVTSGRPWCQPTWLGLPASPLTFTWVTECTGVTARRTGSNPWGLMEQTELLFWQKVGKPVWYLKTKCTHACVGKPVWYLKTKCIHACIIACL